MYLLVDYDNVDAVHRMRGPAHIVEYTLGLLGPEELHGESSINVRFYGGWFHQEALSAKAQELIADLDAQFPRPVEVVGRESQKKLLVRGSLARSLLADPGFDISDTFRERSYPSAISCRSLPFQGCATPESCPLLPIYKLVTDRVCEVLNCKVRPKHVLYLAEQKLVDTMLVSDLISIAAQGEKLVAVVSNDDDIWPGIRTAYEFGIKVLHIHPKKDRRTRESYVNRVSDNYSQFSYKS